MEKGQMNTQANGQMGKQTIRKNVKLGKRD